MAAGVRSKREEPDTSEISAQLAELVLIVKDQASKVVDLHQTIRGYNGHKGMVAQFERLDEKVGTIENNVSYLAMMQEDIASMKAAIRTINERGCLYGQESGTHEKKETKEVVDDKNTVKWDELRKEFFWPVVVALVIAAIFAVPTIAQLINN